MQSSEAEAKPLPMIAMSTWVMTCSLEQKDCVMLDCSA